MVVCPLRSPGLTSKDAKPYGLSASRKADQGASSITYTGGRLPVAGSTAPTPVMTRAFGGLKKSWLDGAEVPPPPITMWTVPLVVSMVRVPVATGIGVRVSVGCWPRMGCERS